MKYARYLLIAIALVGAIWFLDGSFVETAHANNGLFGIDKAQIRTIATATNSETSLISLVRTVINYFLGFLGILSVAIFIYGGVMYVTAGVNEQGAETGKKAMTYAAIGIVVILLSFVIVRALLSAGSQAAPDPGTSPGGYIPGSFGVQIAS
jgi:hypothetical protein